MTMPVEEMQVSARPEPPTRNAMLDTLLIGLITLRCEALLLYK